MPFSYLTVSLFGCKYKQKKMKYTNLWSTILCTNINFVPFPLII